MLCPARVPPHPFSVFCMPITSSGYYLYFWWNHRLCFQWLPWTSVASSSPCFTYTSDQLTINWRFLWRPPWDSNNLLEQLKELNKNILLTRLSVYYERLLSRNLDGKETHRARYEERAVSFMLSLLGYHSPKFPGVHHSWSSKFLFGVFMEATLHRLY